MKTLLSAVRNYPLIVNIAIYTAVLALYMAGSLLDWEWIIPRRPPHFEPELIIPIYLGMGALAAISAGFAGVVIVFGITSQSKLFRRFRRRAENRLSATWSSVISLSFVAAALSIVASLFEAAGCYRISGALFLLGCLLLIHSTIRLLWIMHVLLKLVSADDKLEIDKENRVDLF
jgi:uncharacterized membrane protein YhdT